MPLVRGGGAAAPAQQFKRDTAGREQELDACAEVRLDAGEVIVSITQPGGGYGPPFEREPERVQEDIAEGLDHRRTRTRGLWRCSPR